MPTSISTTNPNEKIFATTLEEMIPAISFEISTATVLTAVLMNKGCVDECDANAVKVPVVLEDSPNVRNVGLYGTYSTAPTNAPKSAYYTALGKKIGSFVVDKTELGQMNSNPKKLISAQRAQVVETFATSLERDLLGCNTIVDANALPGLLTGIEALAEGSQALSPGGIAKSSYSTWRNRFNSMTTFAVDGRSTWTKTYQQCSRTGSIPDTMITDEDVWRLYEETLAGNLQLQPKSLGMTGFLSIAFRDAAVYCSREFANVADYQQDATGATKISGYTYFLTLDGKPAGEFGLKPEMFARKNAGDIAKSNGRGIELAITKGDMFRLEGPKLMPNADVLQWDIILSGRMVFKSMGRLGITKFTGSVQ